LLKSIVNITAAALSCGAAFAASSGDAKHGQQLFVTAGCYECHGYVGQGAMATGPRIARTDLPLEVFTKLLRSPASDMPPYEAAILSDVDVTDIFVYLQSIPNPPDPNSLSLLYPKGR
jgi:ubiquinol-cytochrome c reductase cytochrome c subunit